MFSRRGIIVSVCALLTGALAVGLYAENRGGRPREGASPAPPVRRAAEPDKPVAQPTRVQIDLFELACTNDQLVRLNPDALSGPDGGDASSPQVLKQLGEWGTARLLVRVDNVVDLTRESRLVNGKDTPMVTDVVVSNGGKVTPSVSYHDVGFKMELEGRWREDATPARADLRCEIECSLVLNRSVEIGGGVKVPAFAKRSIEQRLTVTSGKPVFIVTSDVPGPGDEKAPVNVTVLRLTATQLPD